MSLTSGSPPSTNEKKWSAVTVFPREIPFRSGVSQRTSSTACSSTSRSTAARTAAGAGPSAGGRSPGACPAAASGIDPSLIAGES